MSETTWKFRWTLLDLIIPWGLSIGAAIGCIVALVKGVPLGNSPTAGRVIAVATGLVFLGFIPLWYWIRGRNWKVSFVLENGLQIVLGKRNRPSKSDLSTWSYEVFQIWIEDYLPSEVNTSVKDKYAVFLDKEKISVWDRLVRGYSTKTQIVCGIKDDAADFEDGKGYVKGIFKHELSHQILDACGEPWDEEKHHQLMKEKGF